MGAGWCYVALTCERASGGGISRLPDGESPFSKCDASFQLDCVRRRRQRRRRPRPAVVVGAAAVIAAAVRAVDGLHRRAAHGVALPLHGERQAPRAVEGAAAAAAGAAALVHGENSPGVPAPRRRQIFVDSRRRRVAAAGAAAAADDPAGGGRGQRRLRQRVPRVLLPSSRRTVLTAPGTAATSRTGRTWAQSAPRRRRAPAPPTQRP